MTTTYTIDRQGKDGRFRVWWLSPVGLTCEQLFDTQQDAEDWVVFMEANDA